MNFFKQFYFKEAIKGIRGTVLLNMLGLTLGFTIIILILTWIRHELSYDKFHANSDRLYRVESLLDFTGEPFVWNVAPAPVAAGAKADFPEVEDAVKLHLGYNQTLKISEAPFIAENLYYTTNAFFSLFTVNLLNGNPETVLSDPNSIAISESVASKLFGDSSPMGETLIYQNKYLLSVTGVFEDMPSNSHLKVDYLVSFKILERTGKELNSWDQYDFYTYVLLKEGVDPDTFNQKLSGYLQTKLESAAGTLFLNPLRRIYLFRDPGLPSIKYPSDTRGPISSVILFAIIGLIILTISLINFINLSTAFASSKEKEIGIRKVNGASRNVLILHLFGESFIHTIFSMLGALIIAVILMPLFIKISGKELGPGVLFGWKNIIMYLLLILLTGLTAGIYPALILSSYSPGKVLKSNPQDKLHGPGLRKILVLIQFILSTLFIFSILVISNQIRFMRNSDMGFDKERVMVIYPKGTVEKARIIADQLEQIPGVSEVALGGNVPINMGNWSTFSGWEGNTTDKTLKFHMMQVDDKYFDLLGFELLEGRKLIEGEPRNEALINETAVRRMEISSPVGKRLVKGYNNQEFIIVGVVKDFHFRKLKEEINPIIMYKSNSWYTSKIFVKMESGNHYGLVEKIEGIVEKDIPDFPVRFVFLDEEIDNYYADERRQSALINIATLLSIIISSIGLFSLTAYSILRKRKEIGIKKAHGALAINLLLLLNKEFWMLLLIASVIAIPVGYLIMIRWLNTFAYHIELGPLFFIVTVLITFTIATITILYHTLKAAGTNPADALRDE